MNDREQLRDNYTGWRGRSVSGGMPSWALLSKWEQTGVSEDINQMRNYHRSELRDFSCEKPWLEADMQVNGGIDPYTGQSRSGGTRSRGMLNLRFGGARNNTSPYLPDGVNLDFEFLDNKDHYVPHNNKYEKNYTAGKAGVSRGNGPNWEEYNRQRKYRGKYIKYYNDGDYSTVEHGITPAKMQENLMKARFTGLNKLKRTGRVLDGRKSGKMPFYERNGEKIYHAIDQKVREENIHRNYKQWTDDVRPSQNQQFIDQDQDHHDGHYGRDNAQFNGHVEVDKAQRSALASGRVMRAFKDNNVQKSLHYILNTLNNADGVSGTQRATEGFVNAQRKLGVSQFNPGAETQLNSIESRAYEIARVLQGEINARKLGVAKFTPGTETQLNSIVDNKIAEYMAITNRKLGPLEVTLNLKEASLQTGLQPGAEVMDFMNSNKRSMAIDVLDLPRSQLNSKIAHYRDDSRATMNFSSVNPKLTCNLQNVNGEDYGAGSDDTILYKSSQPLYNGLKTAYHSDDMSFQEEAVDKACRSTAKGKGQTRRSALSTHREDRRDDDGNMNEIGYDMRN